MIGWSDYRAPHRRHLTVSAGFRLSAVAGIPSGTTVALSQDVSTCEYGRRIVVGTDFESTLGRLSRALRDEGLFALARIDVRDHFMRDQRRMFRLYEIIEAWSPEVAVETVSHHLDAGVLLPTRFVIYELADGETAVVASEPLSSMTSHPHWREEFPDLAIAADREAERVARVLARLQCVDQTTPKAAAV